MVKCEVLDVNTLPTYGISGNRFVVRHSVFLIAILSIYFNRKNSMGDRAPVGFSVTLLSHRSGIYIHHLFWLVAFSPFAYHGIQKFEASHIQLHGSTIFPPNTSILAGSHIFSNLDLLSWRDLHLRNISLHAFYYINFYPYSSTSHCYV